MIVALTARREEETSAVCDVLCANGFEIFDLKKALSLDLSYLLKKNIADDSESKLISIDYFSEFRDEYIKRLIDTSIEVAMKRCFFLNRAKKFVIPFVSLEEEVSLLTSMGSQVQLLHVHDVNFHSYGGNDVARLRKLMFQRPSSTFLPIKKSTKKVSKNFHDFVMRHVTLTPEGMMNPYCLKTSLVGLDLAMGTTGIAAIAHCVFGQEYLVFGKLKTKKTDCDINRANQISGQLHEFACSDAHSGSFIIDPTEATDVIVEGGALGAVQGAFRIGRFSGLFMSHFLGCNIVEVAPTSLKKLATGYGHCDKKMVIRDVKEKLGLPESFSMDDNTADALALVLFCRGKLDKS